MKIPVYTSSAQPTTSAPGRPITARMNAQPFVQAELQKGAVVGELMSQVGAYAATRYKVMTENALNEALLGAEETLRTRAAELKDSPDYKRALDGDDPIWTRETQEIREGLSDTFGGNVYAQQRFDAQFGQLEMRHRFQLRGDIDARIKREAAAAWTQTLIRYRDDVASGTDVASFDLNTKGVNTSAAGIVMSGAGNEAAVSAQVRAALLDGAQGALTNYAERYGAGAPIAIDNLRAAIRDGTPENLDAESQYVYALISGLEPDEQYAIFSGVSRIENYLNAPTEAEKRLRTEAEAAANNIYSDAGDIQTDIANGVAVDPAAVSRLGEVLQNSSTYLDPEKYSAARDELIATQELVKVSEELKDIGSLQVVEQMLSGLQAGGVVGRTEEVLVDFLRARRSAINTATSQNTMLEFAESVGSHEVASIPFDNPAQITPEMIQQRIDTARSVQAMYNTPGMQLLKRGEAQVLSAALEGKTGLERVGLLLNMTRMLGEKNAPMFLAQLSNASPLDAHVGGLIMDGRVAESEIIMRGMDRIQTVGRHGSFEESAAASTFFATATPAFANINPAVANRLERDINEAAVAYYTDQAARRGIPPDTADFNADLWEEAVMAASGYDKTTGRGGIQTVRGLPTFIPKDMTPRDITFALKNLNPRAFADGANVPGKLALSGRSDEELAESLGQDTVALINDIRDNEDYHLSVIGRNTDGSFYYAITYGEYGEDSYAVMSYGEPNNGPIYLDLAQLLQSEALP